MDVEDTDVAAGGCYSQSSCPLLLTSGVRFAERSSILGIEALALEIGPTYLGTRNTQELC